MSTSGLETVRAALLLLWALWLAVAVGLDTARRRLPNAWLLAGAGLALVLALLPHGMGLAAAWRGGLIALLVFLPGYVLHRLGAGDVKLMAVAGLQAGDAAVWGLCLAVMFAGGVQALLWQGWRAWFATDPSAALRPAALPVTSPPPARPLPYAWAVAAGCGLHLLTGPWTGA